MAGNLERTRRAADLMSLFDTAHSQTYDAQ
jgi:hypothetical protein